MVFMADQTYHEDLKHYQCKRCASLGRLSYWSIGDGPDDCPCPWCMQELAEDAIYYLGQFCSNGELATKQGIESGHYLDLKKRLFALQAPRSCSDEEM